jgi:hypothetical protein
MWMLVSFQSSKYQINQGKLIDLSFRTFHSVWNNEGLFVLKNENMPSTLFRSWLYIYSGTWTLGGIIFFSVSLCSVARFYPLRICRRGINAHFQCTLQDRPILQWVVNSDFQPSRNTLLSCIFWHVKTVNHLLSWKPQSPHHVWHHPLDVDLLENTFY